MKNTIKLGMICIFSCFSKRFLDHGGIITPKVPGRAEDISPLLIGEAIPKATLSDFSGKLVDINKSVAEKPTILVFYRGGWCPYCSKQLSGLHAAMPDLEKLGYQLIAISSDSPDELKKTLSDQKLSYTLLSDSNLSLSKQFGIAFKAPKEYGKFLPKTSARKNKELLLPVPSVFIIDKSGKIQFEYISPDFKHRLSPGLLKAVAAEILPNH